MNSRSVAGGEPEWKRGPIRRRRYGPQLCLTVIVIAVAPLLAQANSPELAESFKTIRSVGPEGRGNQEVAAAWKTVSASDGTALIPILEAMDGANDYAANWLRSAFETVAGREQKAGRKLPLTELGQFLLETRHAPRARRLAFESVAGAEPGTAQRLLSGMLNDPSLEIRYEAVENLTNQAGVLLAAGNQPGAGLLLQQALGAARDVEQIDGISKQLKNLGRTVDLLSVFGFLTDWKIIGPFDNTGNKGFDTAYGPETRLDFEVEYPGKTAPARWRDFTTNHKYGMVDMNQPYGKLKGVVAYAVTEFHSDRAQPAELRLGGKNSWKLWLNGKLLFSRDEYHTRAAIDQYVMPAQLEAGRNTILVKVCQNEEVEEWTVQWEFQLRVTDALGTPIAPAKSNSK